MSVTARNYANQCRTGSKTAKAVMLVLADAAKEKEIVGGTGTAHQCGLSQETIAERVECSIPSVQRALRVLNVDGRILSKFAADGRGYRRLSTFYLNVNGEPSDSFASRCGITWRATPPKHQNDGKASGRLNIIREAPTHHSDVASVSNREKNRERARANNRLQSTELAEDWALPQDWRDRLREEFEATNEQLEKLAKRFHNHYRNIAKPKDRRRENWFAQLRQWCLDDLPARKGGGLAHPPEEFPDEVWCAHVKFWVEHQFWNDGIGPAPDKPGCRAPQRILEQFGLQRSQQAA